MSVKVNEIDIKDMVQGGTYTTKKTIQGLTGFPSGKVPSSSFVYPKPFGIVVNGVDICNQYEALYAEHTINSTGNFPTWCKSYKVICISGGQGASGSTGGYTTNRLAFVMPRMGNNGTSGYVKVETGTITSPVPYTVTLGLGGAGGASSLNNEYSKTGVVLYGKSGVMGAPTRFSYDNKIIETEDGKRDTYDIPDMKKYGLGGTGYYSDGARGGNGYCRVYFYG